VKLLVRHDAAAAGAAGPDVATVARSARSAWRGRRARPVVGRRDVPTGEAATIGFVFDDDSGTNVRIVVIDPESDAELYRSAEIPVQLGVA
jgi:hypothetical protein